MGRFEFSFLWVIALAGVFSLLIMFGNLFGIGLQRYPGEPRRYHPSGDAEAGRIALETYSCGSCHRIPGIAEARGRVGPSLEEFDRQIYIAGLIPNNAENLVRWIMAPQDIDAKTLMPNLSVSRKDADNMTAYLYEQSLSPFDRVWTRLKRLSQERVP